MARNILLPVDGDPTVSFAFSFAVGSQNDPAGREGLASLTAAMLVEAATASHSYDQILERLYPLATTYEVCVDRERTTIGGRVHRDMLDEFVELLLDAICRPAFREDDFERLRSDAVNFIASTLRFSSDEELAKAALNAAAFAATPYAHPVEGTLTGLAAISLDDVRAFYREHFVRSRLVLGIAGGYEQHLVARVEEKLAALPVGQAATPPAIEPARVMSRQVVLVDKPGADASISLGFPLATVRGEKDFYALWIANSWLGEHRHSASHLYQVIREARGLNYGDYSYIEAFPDAGSLQMPPVNVPRRRQLFEIWIRTLPNDQAVFALRAALRELERLIELGMSKAEFELTRGFLRKYSAHFAPTTEARLGYAIDDAFYSIDGDGHLARFRQQMDSLSLGEVNDAIRRHLQTDALTIAIVSGAADQLARQLSSAAPTPVEYPNPMPPAVLEEDPAISVYPLRIEADAIRRWPVTEIFG